MKKFHFYRETDNFAYVNGSIDFGNNTENTLVISDKETTKIDNLKDSFICFYQEKEYIYPISDLENVLQISNELLRKESIVYHIPKSIQERELLDKKNIGKLSQELYKNYGIVAKKINSIDSTGRKNGIFLIVDNDKQYILKHWGKSNNRLNALAKIANSSNGTFPRILETKDSSYSIHMRDGYYGLEEFIEGKTKERKGNYFTEIGKAMAYMHEELNKLFLEDESLREILLSETRSVGESNVASLWIDSNLAGYLPIREEIKKLGKEKLREKIKVSPESYIHGDLNNSNIIWTNNIPRFIDIETTRISRRIFDVEATLLLPGNMVTPNYIPGSLDLLINSYNEAAQKPLSDEEKRVSKKLMEYSLLKNFVIRNIRRSESEHSVHKLNKNLEKIRKEN